MKITLKEYAKLQGVSYSRATHLAVEGKLPTEKICGKRYIEETTAWPTKNYRRGIVYCRDSELSANALVEMYPEIFKGQAPSNSRLSNILRQMKQRCSNPKNTHWHCYGGKGIKVCDEWANNPLAFYKWACENGYRDDLTIDRIDGSKGYSPDNCRWVTKKQNSAHHTMSESGRRALIEKRVAKQREKDKEIIRQALEYYRTHHPEEL